MESEYHKKIRTFSKNKEFRTRVNNRSVDFIRQFAKEEGLDELTSLHFLLQEFIQNDFYAAFEMDHGDEIIGITHRCVDFIYAHVKKEFNHIAEKEN